jgi:hypothetical protein
VSPKVLLVKVLFCSSPTTVDLQSTAAWDWIDAFAPHGVTQIASAKRKISPGDLVDMPDYLSFRTSNCDCFAMTDVYCFFFS